MAQQEQRPADRCAVVSRPLRLGWIDIDARITLFLSREPDQQGWFRVYINHKDAGKRWYKANELGSQANLVEDIGAEDAATILDWWMS